MKHIPVTTENALLIRTDFSDQAAWKGLLKAVSEPGDPFIFNMEVVDDRNYSGATVEQLMGALGKARMLENLRTTGDSVAWSDVTPYIKVPLVCPRGGTYILGRVGEQPRCSIGGTHTLPPDAP